MSLRLCPREEHHMKTRIHLKELGAVSGAYRHDPRSIRGASSDQGGPELNLTFAAALEHSVYFSRDARSTAMNSTSLNAFPRLAGAVVTAALLLTPLHAAQETELKDENGKTVIKYVIEAPPNIAAAGMMDPARQDGLILCSQE